MPPHLHPRSRLTSSLFATTLFASFFVVALPHVLPCPAPRVAFADENGKRRRRRKCVPETETEHATAELVKEEESSDEMDGSSSKEMANKRECPIPKPGGIVGEMLGFKPSADSSNDGKGGRPP